MTKKTPAALSREIKEYMGKSTAGVFWPGGAGGGSSARKRPGSPVVKPHARTSPTCKKCSRYHTTEEHDQHGAATPPRSTPSKKTRTKTKAKTKARTEKKKIGTPISQDTLAMVLHAIHRMPASSRIGPDKIFVSALWDRVKKKIRMSLPEFKNWLLINNRKGTLGLERADAVGAMDPDLVRESEIQSMGATFHFVSDPAARGW